MPWYVYAIHQDRTDNRQYHAKPIMERAEAEKLYEQMKKGCFAHDNYRVAMFEAENDAAAEKVADGKRPYPKLPPAPPATGSV